MKGYVLCDANARRSVVGEICWNCLHFDGNDPALRRCAAFPDGIPLEIWEAERNHDEPYANDGGIRFEHLKGEPITSQNIIDETKRRRSE